MGRLRCSEKLGLKKGPWTAEEDRKLVAYIEEHGHGSWRTLPAKAGLQRCGKSCRLRWINYLSPEIKRGDFSFWEEQKIIQLHALIGNRWSTIAAHLPRRTDNEIKNYWNSHLKKRLIGMGIDPITHRPKTDAVVGSKAVTSNLSHMAQWEIVRLEAEARLASKLGSSSSQPPARLMISRIPARPSLPPCLDVLRALQSSSTKPTNPKGNSIVHSMYAMVLATAIDLESPTSTLSFPASKLPISTTFGKVNDNFLAQTTTSATVAAAAVDFTKSSAACDRRMISEAIENESWKYMEKENLDDHDTRLSVEAAFTSARCENIPEVLFNDVIEDASNGMSIYYSDEIDLAEGNMGMANEDNINHCCWHNILNMVNDFESGSPPF